jgi:uncharacterized membrane protein YsdA (DUF1294 family)
MRQLAGFQQQRRPAKKGEPQNMMIAAGVYLSLVAVMSLVCFITYGVDKRQAVRGGRRVSERTLHLMELLGGWPGALLAQRHFRHKTQKAPFRLVFWLLVALHLGVVGTVALAIFKLSGGAGN